MNQLGKPDGPRSRGCQFWLKQWSFDYSEAATGHPKGWTEEDWARFKAKGKEAMGKKKRKGGKKPCK